MVTYREYVRMSSVSQTYTVIYDDDEFAVDTLDEVNMFASRAILEGKKMWCRQYNITPDHHEWFMYNGMAGVAEFFPRLVSNVEFLLTTPDYEHLADEKVSNKRSRKN